MMMWVRCGDGGGWVNFSSVIVGDGLLSEWIDREAGCRTGRGVRMWAFGNDIKFCYVSFAFSLRALISLFWYLVVGCIRLGI